MKFTNRLEAHSLRLLLYLEWILFAISMLAEFRIEKSSYPIYLLFPPIFPELSTNLFPLSMFCMIAFLILGLWQPREVNWQNIGYIGLGFALIGITAITSNATVRLLPPLLLIMLIRGCLSLNLVGSLIVAGISLSWFFTSLFLTINENVNTIGFKQIPMLISPNIQLEIISQLQSQESQLKFLIVQMAINISILFCLISLFVFLLVNALKSEYFSQLELKKANHKLREYALLIEDRAMLQERNRIAREIHDSLGHSLTAQNIQLANALMYLGSNFKRTENFLLKAKQLGSNALKEVRQSVSTLRSDPLQGKLLTVAIDELLKDFEYRTEVFFDYQSNISETITISREITTAVYRIVQEALTNMLKHSEATEVQLSLKIVDKYLQVEIQDNGVGFTPQENTTGFGIQGMQERTTALQGKFELDSMSNKGCRIKVAIPLFSKL
ncbi:MAG: sensor histidine kinase [Cyanobacteria bacterium P01_A01_bin.40]